MAIAYQVISVGMADEGWRGMVVITSHGVRKRQKFESGDCFSRRAR